MRKLIALLAAGILLFSWISAFAEAPALTYPDRDYDELVVGNPTKKVFEYKDQMQK